MHRVLSLLLILLLIGCGTPPKQMKVTRVSPSLKPYVDHIFNEMMRLDAAPVYPLESVDVYFEDIDQSDAKPGEYTLALCYYSSHRITVDTKLWFKLSENEKISVLAHEIGHCAFELIHNVVMLEDDLGHTQPASIMNPYMNREFADWITAHWDYYIKELFGKGHHGPAHTPLAFTITGS